MKPPLPRRLLNSPTPQKANVPPRPQQQPPVLKPTVVAPVGLVDTDLGDCPKCECSALVLSHDELTAYCPTCFYEMNIGDVPDKVIPRVTAPVSTSSSSPLLQPVVKAEKLGITEYRAIYQHIRVNMALHELVCIQRDLEPDDWIDEELLNTAIKAITRLANSLYHRIQLDAKRIPPK